MDGPSQVEFSGQGVMTHRSAATAPTRATGTSGSQSARGAEHFRHDDSFARKQRLLRGESTYTAASDGRPTEHFVDDQPQMLPSGVGTLLPKAATSEERERLLRRLEMCAKAREESTKIMSIRFAQRDAVKHDLRRERQTLVEKLSESQRDREERWSRRLQRSPFAVDLVAENQRIDEESRVQRAVERRRQKLVQKHNRDAHNAIFTRATAEADELMELRREKRLLIENERQLKALRDVERSNARTAQILQERRRNHLEKEQQPSHQFPPLASSSGGSWTAR